MTHKILFIACLFIVIGCSGEEPFVVVPEKQVDVSEAVFDLSDAKDETEVLTEENVELEKLSIENKIVDWGFTVANRSAEEIDTVIIHSVYNPFDGDSHDLDAVIEIFKGYDVGPHYIIGRSGQIYQTVLEKDIAWHAGRSRAPDGRTDLNDFSIGIEMINSLEDTYTDEQYTSLHTLITDIDSRLGLTYVLGHDEIKVEDPWNFNWDKVNDLRHEAR